MARLTPLRERDRLHVVAVARVHADRRAELTRITAHRHDEVVAAGAVQPLNEHWLARLRTVQRFLEVFVLREAILLQAPARRVHRAPWGEELLPGRTPRIAAALAVVDRRWLRVADGDELSAPMSQRDASHVRRLPGR